MIPRIFFIGILGLVLAPQAALAQSPDWPAALGACRGIFGATERLACYDRLAQGVAAQNLPNPPPPAQAFGAERLPRGAAVARLDTMTSPIASFRLSPTSHFIVVLANGQTWRQVEGDDGKARFHPGETRAVTISRGAFGSYNLVFNDRSVVFRVARVN